jgi:hypothetical protein
MRHAYSLEELGGLFKKLFSFRRINGFVTLVASTINCNMSPTSAFKALDRVFAVPS